MHLANVEFNVVLNFLLLHLPQTVQHNSLVFSLCHLEVRSDHHFLIATLDGGKDGLNAMELGRVGCVVDSGSIIVLDHGSHLLGVMSSEVVHVDGDIFGWQCSMDLLQENHQIRFLDGLLRHHKLQDPNRFCDA